MGSQLEPAEHPVKEALSLSIHMGLRGDTGRKIAGLQWNCETTFGRNDGVVATGLCP